MPGFTDFQRLNLAGLQPGAIVLAYTFAAQDFKTAWTEAIQGPTNLRGKVANITLFECSELFADGTGRVVVGVEGGDVNSYTISEAIGTLAATDSISLDLTDGVTGTIPADNVQVSVAGGATTTPNSDLTGGVSSVVVSIAWFV